MKLLTKSEIQTLQKMHDQLIELTGKHPDVPLLQALNCVRAELKNNNDARNARYLRKLEDK